MANIILGNDTTTGQPVTLKEKDYALGGYFIGVRRVGKSFLLEQLILQSIENKRGVCVIDPHGDLIENIIGRLPQQRIDNGDVILLDPLDADGAFPFGLNIYKCENKTNPRLLQYTIDSVMHLFEKLWPAETTQPMVEDVVRVSAATIIANDMTMVEIPRLILDRNFRAKLLSKVTNYDVLSFWESFDHLPPAEQERQGGIVARRVRKFTTNEIVKYIVGQSEKTLDFRSIIDSPTPKIVLVRLYRDMKEMTSLVGSMIIAQLLQAALSRSTTENRPEFHLYCDEYANFATSDFSTIIEEAGKYNIIPFIGHQSRGQISEENQDSAMQLGLIVNFRVIPRDNDDMAACFNCKPETRQLVIPSDPTMYLTTHPNRYVKQFEQRFARKMLQAKGERTRYEASVWDKGLEGQIHTTNEIRPEFDFGGGEKVFERKDLLQAIDILDRILYKTMLQEQVQNNIIDELLELVAYLLECSFIYEELKKEGNLTDDYMFSEELEKRFKTMNHTTSYYFEFTLFSYFYSLFYSTRAALAREPIYVSPSTGSIPQQTFADRQAEIANELKNLHQRTARIKVNRRHEGITEHTITTINQTGRQNYKAKRAQVVAFVRDTANGYTKPRAEVEEEIRRRQDPDNYSPTKRRG